MFIPLTTVLAMAQTAQSPMTEVTVYNQGFGLVKQIRFLDLKKGIQEIPIEDVAQRIESNSVGIKSLSAPGSFSVLEQNYQYDLISVAAILNKAVGQTVTLRRTFDNGKSEEIKGTLMVAPTNVVSMGEGSQMTYNGLVLKENGSGRILLNPTGEVIVDSIPEGLISKPTLKWLLDSDQGGENKVQLSYLTQGMAWSSDYVMQLDKDGKMADLKGWVTLQNNCGTTFKDAKLKLLAGEVNRAPGGRAGGAANYAAAPMQARKAKADMVEESFAEYHLYTLDRATTIRNNEQKQVSLLETFRIPCKKRILFDPMRDYWGWRPQAEGEVGSGVLHGLVSVQFTNDKKSQMGMPLPAGNIKVFMNDASGSTQLVGEDRIEHTPKDEKVSLNVGRAFDVVGERKRTEFEWIRRGNNIVGARETFTTELRNRKESPEEVTLWERYWGEWQVAKSTEKFTKLDANTAEVVVTLKPNEVRKITYTFEVRW